MKALFILLVSCFILSSQAFGQDEFIFDSLFEDLDISVVDESGRNYLHLAVLKENSELVDYFSTKYPELLVGRDVEKGDTPFLLSCFIENLDIMKIFLAKGVNINDANDDEITCLHYFLFTGVYSNLNQKIMFLIDNGADWTKKDKDGDTAFLAACSSGNFEFIKFFIEEKNVDVNERNNEGNTCLHYFVGGKWGGVDKKGIMSYLLEKGADPKAKNSKGETPGNVLMPTIKPQRGGSGNDVFTA